MIARGTGLTDRHICFGKGLYPEKKEKWPRVLKMLIEPLERTE